MKIIAVICWLSAAARVYVAINDFLAGVNAAGALLIISAIVTPIALGAVCWELARLVK